MKIVHVLAGTGFGGAERVACTLARGGLAAGWQVQLECHPMARVGLAEYALTSLAEEADLMSWSHAARNRVREFGPNVVHVHLASPSFLGHALRIAGGHRSLFTFHLLPESQWPLDRLTKLPSRWLMRLSAAWRRQLLFNTVSATDAQRLAPFLSIDRLRCVLNAPPLQAFGVHSEGAPTTAIWRAEQSVRLLIVGRLVSQKGHERLLRALAVQRVRTLPWQLALVGDGPERAQLMQLAVDLGVDTRLTWLGAVPSYSWIRSAHLVISPSLFEGMPLVPMEAVRAGVPVLLSDIAPHRELFADTGSGCLLPATPDLWPDVLEALISSPAARKKLLAEQTALVPLLDPERQFQDYARLYRTLAVI